MNNLDVTDGNDKLFLLRNLILQYYDRLNLQQFQWASMLFLNDSRFIFCGDVEISGIENIRLSLPINFGTVSRFRILFLKTRRLDEVPSITDAVADPEFVVQVMGQVYFVNKQQPSQAEYFFQSFGVSMTLDQYGIRWTRFTFTIVPLDSFM